MSFWKYFFFEFAPKTLSRSVLDERCAASVPILNSEPGEIVIYPAASGLTRLALDSSPAHIHCSRLSDVTTTNSQDHEEPREIQFNIIFAETDQISRHLVRSDGLTRVKPGGLISWIFVTSLWLMSSPG